MTRVARWTFRVDDTTPTCHAEVGTIAVGADTTAGDLAPPHSVAESGAMRCGRSADDCAMDAAVFVRRRHFPLLPVAAAATRLAPYLSQDGDMPGMVALGDSTAPQVVVVTFSASAGVNALPLSSGITEAPDVGNAMRRVGGNAALDEFVQEWENPALKYSEWGQHIVQNIEEPARNDV
jgi:hypothetical protein